jgi:simple sugar transport system permease protein
MSLMKSVRLNTILVPIISLILAIILGTVLLIFMEFDAIYTWGYLIVKTMTPNNIANTLFNATPLLLTGLSVAVAFRGGMFNIGTEGQMIFGGFMSALAGFGLGQYFNIQLPPYIMIPLVLIMGMIGGAIWGAVPGILKAYRGVHEVITTIMMNNIALVLMIYLVGEPEFSPFIDRFGGNTSPLTPKIAQSARLEHIGDTLINTPLGFLIEPFKHSLLHWGLIIGLLACVISYILLWRTRYGYETRAVGFNRIAAEYGGINVSRNIIKTMMICGALGGLAGALEVMGTYYRYIDGFSAGSGFDGIAVALLGGNHPFGIIFGAILFGWLTTGGIVLDIGTDVPKDVANTLKGFIVFFVAVPLIAQELLNLAQSRGWDVRIKTKSREIAVGIKDGWVSILVGLIAFIVLFLFSEIIPIISQPLQDIGDAIFQPLSEFFNDFDFLVSYVEFLERIFSIELFFTAVLLGIVIFCLVEGRQRGLHRYSQYILLILGGILSIDVILRIYKILGQDLTLFSVIGLTVAFIIYQEFQVRGSDIESRELRERTAHLRKDFRKNLRLYSFNLVLVLGLIILIILTASIRLPNPIDLPPSDILNIPPFITLTNWGSFVALLGIFALIASIIYISRLDLPETHNLFHLMTAIRILYGFITVSLIFGLNSTNLLRQTLEMAAPIGLASLGGMFSEKSGVVNIGLEGMMLSGSFVSVWITFETNDPWLGVLGAIFAGVLMGLLHAIASIRFRADQVVVGVAINLFASAVTALGILIVWNVQGTSESTVPFKKVKLDFLTEIPIIGDVLYQLLGAEKGLSPIVYVFILAIIVSTWVIQRTAFGLRVRAVGEHPRAADTLGINVYQIRYVCVVLSGILAAVGGAQLTLGTVPRFRSDVTGGRGFVALAALIFGGWNPVGAALASLLFAFAYAFLAQFGLRDITWIWNIENLVSTLPFVITIVTVATVARRARAPAADGIPYVKEG